MIRVDDTLEKVFDLSVKCDQCGKEFEYDFGELKIEPIGQRGVTNHYYVTCPRCNKRIDLYDDRG